jgi:hypothetical protein
MRVVAGGRMEVCDVIWKPAYFSTYFFFLPKPVPPLHRVHATTYNNRTYLDSSDSSLLSIRRIPGLVINLAGVSANHSVSIVSLSCLFFYGSLAN